MAFDCSSILSSEMLTLKEMSREQMLSIFKRSSVSLSNEVKSKVKPSNLTADSLLPKPPFKAEKINK